MRWRATGSRFHVHTMLDSTGSASLLEGTQPGRIGALLGRVLSLGYRVTGRHRYDDFRLERVGQLQILVLPSVANPKVLRTGAFFAAQLDERIIAANHSVLDLGTGSGVCAVAAARLAREVVGTDINPAAIRCAKINAMISDLDKRIELREGDLFAPVRGRQFDVVLFNPPFIEGAPANDRDAAWRGENIARRFAAELPAHLAAGGTALLLLSSFGNTSSSFEAELARQRFSLSVFARRRFVNETLSLLKVTRAGEG